MTKISSSLSVSLRSAIGGSLALAFILLASNFVIINAQQQQQQLSTSQPGEFGNATTTEVPAVTPPPFQSLNDSFSIQVPDGWIIDDMNNTGPALLEETRRGYGVLAQQCSQEEQQQGAGALSLNATSAANNATSSNSCQGAQEEVVHILRYPELETRIQPANNITVYHLQKLQEVGYRNIQTINSADMAVNLTNLLTNQTVKTLPAKFVEMTYTTTTSAPNETRTGYFVLTATNMTAPNSTTIKGYSVFYEGNSNTSTTAARPEITTTTSASDSLASATLLSPAVAKIFDSFELIVAPEVAQALAQQEAAAVGQTGGGGREGDTTCDSSYPDVCLPPPPPNLNCGDPGVPQNFRVLSPDPHGFDGDNDGIGCESGSNPPDLDESDNNSGSDGSVDLGGLIDGII